jgi:hypothetical protein
MQCVHLKYFLFMAGFQKGCFESTMWRWYLFGKRVFTPIQQVYWLYVCHLLVYQ